MNKHLIFIALISVVMLYACGGTKDFNRSSELFSYLNKVQGLNLQREVKAQVFIFQVGFCGACTGEVMMLIEENKDKFKDSTYFILSSPDKKLEQRLAKIPKSSILLDKSYLLHKYGLNYSKDMFFVLENGEIKKWFKLDTDDIKVAHNYINKEL